MDDERRLADLVSVGPATVNDLRLLGITTVAQLRRRDPQRLYDRLCQIKRTRLDPCCADVLHAAVAQARDPRLPDEQCQWWYWSRLRKGQARHERISR